MNLSVDREVPLSLQEQLSHQIRLLIDGSELKPGDPLPTIKATADELAINPNTVAAAYRTLEQEGYLVQRRRAGTMVAARPPRRPDRALAAMLASDVVGKARAAGLSVVELARAIGARSVAQQGRPRLRVAVLAASRARALEQAARATAALGDGLEFVPLLPHEYASVDYHLTIVDPLLTERLSDVAAGSDLASFVHYGPEFPAAAD